MIARRRRTMQVLSLLLLCSIAPTTNAFTFRQPRRRYLPQRQDPVPIRTHRQVNTKLPSTLGQTISQLSNPASAFTQLTKGAQATPAIAYFLVLLSAGFGVPVSEDLLCIFAGTMLPLDKIQSPARRIRLITALYLGVVISDLVTFTIGRMMKVGLLEPLRKRMNLGQKQSSKLNEGSNIEEIKLSKRDKVIQKLESAGDWAGFYARMSVGFRPAMMILSGFSGKVSFAKYTLGTAAGAVISLTAQLLLGFSMRHKPSDILAFSSKLLVVAPMALISAAVVWLMRQKDPSNNNRSEPTDTKAVVGLTDDSVEDAIAKAEVS